MSGVRYGCGCGSLIGAGEARNRREGEEGIAMIWKFRNPETGADDRRRRAYRSVRRRGLQIGSSHGGLTNPSVTKVSILSTKNFTWFARSVMFCRREYTVLRAIEG